MVEDTKWHKTYIWRVQDCCDISQAVTVSLSMLNNAQIWVAVFTLAAGTSMNVHIVKVTCIYALINITLYCVLSKMFVVLQVQPA